MRARLPRVEQTPFTWYFGDDDAALIRPSTTWGHPDQRTLLAAEMAL
ncbi:hypothetical protein [Nonomuraea sp. NPDC050783]